MTIIAAYKTKENIWIGSDSEGFSNVKNNFGSKLIKKKNYIVGFSGSYRIGDIIREEKSLPNTINNRNDLLDFRDLLRLSLIERTGASEVDEDPDSHPVYLLLVSKLGIYKIGTNYQLLHCKNNYMGIGAGEEIALGALSIYSKQKEEDGAMVIRESIKSTIKHCATTGGRIYVSSFYLKQ